MVDSVFMAELSWPEFEAKTKAKAPFFLPIGATEQHGPHLPLNVDVVLPTGVAAAVAKNVGGVVAPPFPMATNRSHAPAAARLFRARRASTPIRSRWSCAM